MENLKMHTPDLAEENFRKLAAMFPNAVTETINEDGEVVRAIDADVLRQEISATVVEGAQDRYQFTWPDKRNRWYLPTSLLLKPCDLTGRSLSAETEHPVASIQRISTLRVITLMC